MTCPLPRYWMCHALIAGILMLALLMLPHAHAAAAGGALLYVGRELRDREKLGSWDLPGLIAPIASNAALLAVILLLAGCAREGFTQTYIASAT